MQELIDFWKEKIISGDINEEDVEILNIIDQADRDNILKAVPDLKRIFRNLHIAQDRKGKLFFYKIGMPVRAHTPELIS
jgi:hypothetical protein